MRTKFHVLCEILKSQQDLEGLEEMLALAREASVEHSRRYMAEEEEYEREKEALSAQIKMREEQLMQLRAEEERRLLELEREQNRIKSASEEKKLRLKTEEVELTREKEKLQDALARVKVVVPFSVLNSTASVANESIFPRAGERAASETETQRRKSEEDELLLDQGLENANLVVPFRNMFSTTAANSGDSQMGMRMEKELEGREEKKGKDSSKQETAERVAGSATDIHRDQSITALSAAPMNTLDLSLNALGTFDLEATQTSLYPRPLLSAAALASAADVGSSPPQDDNGIAGEAESGAVDDTTHRQGSSPRYSSYVKSLQTRLFNLTNRQEGGGETTAGSLLKSPGVKEFPYASDLSAMTLKDVTMAIDDEASPVVVSTADERKVDEAQRELGPWLRQIGFAEDDVANLVLQLSKPDFGVTNRAILFSLEEGDVDDILEGCPLGHKRIIKKNLKREKNE